MTNDGPALLDLNVLIALTWPSHVHHQLAQSWFASRPSRAWATTLVTELGFLRLSCNPRVVGRHVPFPAAVRLLAQLHAWPGHTFITDASSLAVPAISLDRLATSRQITDLHLVNLCASVGAVLATFDQAIPSYLDATDRKWVELITPENYR